MASALTNPSFSVSSHADLQGGGNPAPTSSPVRHDVAQQFIAGSGAGMVNKVYVNQGNLIASGTPLDIDLTSVNDPLGAAITFGVINSIILENLDMTPTHDLTLGGAVTNSFCGAMTIPAYGGTPAAGGTMAGVISLSMGTTGKGVDGTHKILRITAGAGAAVSFKLTIKGQ